ncbi:MAG: hypothetical protein H8M99_14080 [Gloeobacteraceae cyanobacterium ES-bin-144]|nr:hypothetical protein [Verrucomicrobiales bacterium]
MASHFSPLTAGESARGESLAETELNRRNASIQEAQELLLKGDEAYQAGRYADAVEAYSGAFENIPNAPISAELRDAAADRYAQASVELARVLSKKGDIAGAKATVDKVLREGVAPNNAGALAFRAQLDDPIRTNPALTKEHAKNVDEVRRLLYTAEGAYNLGKFDEANQRYNEVLRIDATNSAARRGMERVAAAKKEYYKAAYDQTRSEMLNQVGAAWELQPPPMDADLANMDLGFQKRGLTATVAAKIDQIIIPKVMLDQVTLSEALDFLRIQATANDMLELDPAKKGVNFTVNLGPPDSEKAKAIENTRFNLKITSTPLSQILKYITEATHTSFSTDDFSVVIKPVGSSSDSLITRSYQVPPDFITSLSGSGTATAEAPDPFGGAASTKPGLLTTRLSAKDALMKQGVTFPEGASANYNANSSNLLVTNTANNQAIIEQIVSSINQTEPVMVAVRVTMITAQQTNLKELGFDWLVSPMALTGANNIFGSGGTTGNTPGRKGGDFISPVDGVNIPGVPTTPDGIVNPGLMTNGLRSGTQAITQNSIEQLVNDPNRTAQNTSVAPGILGLTGLFSNGQVQMIMRGLDQKKGVDILARPSVVSRSGHSAKVEILREFIYPSEYEPPELPNSVGIGSSSGSFPVTPATPTAFETKNLGITLEVLPVADANKQYIDVTLNPSFSDFVGFVNYGSPIFSSSQDLLGNSVPELITPNRILMPLFSAERLSTQLTVADGTTIVMGGLMSDSVQTVEDKVPVFGDIPIIGRWFTSTSRQPTTTAIIFMVNVQLLDPAGRPYRGR